MTIKNRILLSLLVLSITFVFSSYHLSASVVGEPNCFVTAKIINIPDDSRDNLYIIQVRKKSSYIFCPVKMGGEYEISDRLLSGLQVGDNIKAGVVAGSSMGVDGNAVPWLHWSDITIVTKKNTLVNMRDKTTWTYLIYVLGVSVLLIILYIIYRVKQKQLYGYRKIEKKPKI